MKMQTKSIYAPFYDCPPILKEYLDYMITIKGRSVRTVDGYYIEIRTFLRYIKLYAQQNLDGALFSKTSIEDVSVEQITQVTLSDVYSFLNFVSTTFSVGSSSRARKISAIRGFYNYLTKKSFHLKENPLRDLELPNKRKTLPKHLTLESSNRLLDTCESGGSSRDHCMLTLFLNCGMRLSELVGIDLSDIRDDSSLYLLGKGNRERIVYLNDACIASIGTYLQDTNEIRRQDNALFVNSQGKRLGARRVEQIVESALKAAGLAGMGYSPHKLRHTAATLLYQHGNVDVRILKEILGHTNLATTEIYTHVSDRQMENAASASPLSGRKPKKTVKPDEES